MTSTKPATGHAPLLAAALALGTLALVVPVQGVRDRLGDSGDRPPSSGAADYDTAAIDLVSSGAWWRVEPDYSYFLVMHDRFARGLAASPPLVATYGPWGFLYRGSTRETYLPAVAAWAFLGAGFAAVAWLAARETAAARAAQSLWVVALLSGIAVLPRDLALLLLPAGLAAGRDEEDDAVANAVRAFACAAAGLAALVKHNALALSLVALGLLVVRRLAAGRRPGPEPFVLAGSFLAFWLGAGGRLADLPDYFAGAFSVVAAYTESASIPAEPGSRGLLLVAALLAAVLAAETLAAARRRERAAVLTALATAAVALVLFKSGALRSANHEHLVLAFAGLASLALLRLPAWAASLAGGREGRLLAIGTAVAGLVVAPLVPVGELVRQLGAWGRPSVSRRASDARASADLAAVRERNPLPPIAGTVDLFQNRHAILLAHGLDFRPRPVFQSYLATGGSLSRRNARHLAGPSAPGHVLFEAWSIDGRLPALDDALAGLELLRRYDVTAVSERLALLRRRAAPKNLSLVSAGEATVRLGEEAVVPLPSGRLVWVTARVEPTPFGRLAALVYKVPELGVRLRLAGGRETRWRYVRSAGATGFLLSPSVEGALDMALLVAGQEETLAPKGVTGVTIGLAGGGSSLAYRDRVELRFHEVVIGSPSGDDEGEAVRPPLRVDPAPAGEVPTASSP
ncbi:MAG: hypothetical protein ACYDBY_14835 [Thermoanaerobaculia bacterium]